MAIPDTSLDQQDLAYAARLHEAAREAPRTFLLRRERVRIGRLDDVSETRLHVAALGEDDSEVSLVEWPRGVIVAAARFRDPDTGEAPSPAFAALASRAREAMVVPPV